MISLAVLFLPSFSGAAGPVDFAPLPRNWSWVATPPFAAIPSDPDASPVLLNTPDNTRGRRNLFTAASHGDTVVSVEFMMAKGSNSGVYLMGRYEVQLFDSFGVESPRFSDCGGIYERWDESTRKGREGRAPALNACLAPGTWQRLHIDFRAPRFNANGAKSENARLVRVVLNGITLHENVELTGPTRAAAFSDEQPLGPLMLQGDHGPVAFRNLLLPPPVPAPVIGSQSR